MVCQHKDNRAAVLRWIRLLEADQYLVLRLVGAGQTEERTSVEGGADIPVGGEAVDQEGEAGPFVALLSQGANRINGLTEVVPNYV